MSGVIGNVFGDSEPELDKPDPECKKAADLCRQGEFKKAIEVLDKQSSKGEEGAVCRYVRANACLGKGDYADALKAVRLCLKERPKYAPGYFTQGAILAAMDRLDDAIDSYNRAVSLRNKNASYLTARAGVYYRMGRFIDAIRDYNLAIKLDPASAGPLYMLGQCYFMVAQYPMVVIRLTDYLTKMPDNAAALYNRGSAYLELGKYELALEDFNNALQLVPDYTDCLYKRCLVYWHLGNWSAASADANKALKLIGWKESNSAYLALLAYFSSLKADTIETVKANNILDLAVANLKAPDWPYPLFLYLAGRLSDSDLLARAVSQSQKTQARAYIALNLAWSGNNRQKAMALLETVRVEGDSSIPEYDIAVGELFRGKVKDTVNISRPIKSRYALVIGVSKFADSALNLRYSAKDASDFSKFLVSRASFPSRNVKLLVDKDATRENILGALGDKWLPRATNPEDLVIVYFSTHGSPSSMDKRGLNYLLAHDTKKDVLFATGIPIQELARMIKDKVRADRIVVILDACHSGAAEAGETLKIDAGSMSKSSGQAVICSSTSGEVSWESKQYPNGVFTHHLIDGFKLRGSATTVGDSFKYAREHVEKEVWKDRKRVQTPVLKSTWSRVDLPIAKTGKTSN